MIYLLCYFFLWLEDLWKNDNVGFLRKVGVCFLEGKGYRKKLKVSVIIKDLVEFGFFWGVLDNVFLKVEVV